MEGVQAAPGDEELIRVTEDDVADMKTRLKRKLAEDVAKGPEKAEGIKFRAHVWKVGTLGTGGLRVQLNLDKEYIREMAMLAGCQHELIELEFQAIETIEATKTP